MQESTARRMWELYEPVHDVVYFTPECRAAGDGIGLKGFWMGYFAFRAAPLGAVTAAAVAAGFHGFHDDRVSRALPDAWARCTPQAALDARRAGAAAALRRLWGPEVAGSAAVAEAADLAWTAARAADVAGRMLAAANRALPRPDAPVETLWQAATTLREHRGDGHVAVLTTRRIPPIAAHLLKTAAGESDPTMLREARGWSVAAWEAATGDLRERGWLDRDGRLTADGTAERIEIERATDELGGVPWVALGDGGTRRLAALLEPLAGRIVGSGTLPPRNPVGLTGRHAAPAGYEVPDAPSA